LLAPFGIRCETRSALDKPHFALLGIQVRDGAITHVFDQTPAQAAGISGGDTLVALDGLRIGAANLDSLLARYQPGDTVSLHVFRRDELMRFDVKLARQPPARHTLTVDAQAAKAAHTARARWLRA
jgi:predicted metalloprotease with PDZ domain